MNKIINKTIAISIISFAMVHSIIGMAQPYIFGSSDQAIIENICEQSPDLNANVLKKALIAYRNARHEGLDNKKLLTVVDYTIPSNKKRLWVIDLNQNKVLFHELVAHGKGTGMKYSKYFTNQSGSKASSIGVFLTGKTYQGEHPNSLRLIGLEKGFNDKAYQRTIVMHPAWYASEQFAKQHGYLGRSWGCLAMDSKVEPKVVNTIKNGTIIFSYYPDHKWLSSSNYLKPANQSSSLLA